MLRRQRVLGLTACLLVLALASVSQGAATVRLELVGNAQGAAMSFQQWSRALADAGIRDVRLTTAQEPAQPKMDVQGTADDRIYIVTGIVTRDEIQLPNARFRRSEMGRLAQWINELAAQGPVEQREKKLAFGLSASQLDAVRKDLSESVGVNTQGVAWRDAVRKIAERLKFPLQLDLGDASAIGDDKVKDQLRGLSCGTALACILRPAGFCLVPREDGGNLGYAVVKSQPGQDSWPVGADSGRSAAETLPALYEFRNVNVQNVSAAATLQAVGNAMKTPILLDHLALTRHGLDPAKITVSHPRSRTTYSIALRKMMFQAKLKFDVRCDEAGTPFLWVTTIKPVK